MPIESRWDAAEQLWILTPGPTFEVAEMIALIRKTDWRGARRYLWDVRPFVEGPSTTRDLRRMLLEVERLIEIWDGSRVAIVAQSDLHFGVARMFTAFAINLEIDYQVFRDVRMARAWLDERPPAPVSAEEPVLTT